MIFLLPGMGADGRMYGPAWRTLPEARFPDWPEYRGETTYEQVADRVIAESRITPRDTVGGSSLGGMVALEIARRLDCRVVVLIGSAMDATEVNPLLRRLAPLASVTPLRLAQVISGRGAAAQLSMFSDADPEFIGAMCRALTHWRGSGGNADRLVRIHGANDRVIRCPADCHVIPRAGHLVAMTHAEECVRVLVTQLGTRAAPHPEAGDMFRAK
jgi:pimeloyl-ACP methyl ester carboxylesterase